MAGSDWLAVVDFSDSGAAARSWTVLAPRPAAAPDDPAIPRVRVFADAVARIGFCAPPATPDSAAAAGGSSYLVRAWSLAPASGETGAWTAAPIRPVLLSGGTTADSGALYGPPGSVPLPGGAPTGAAPSAGAPVASGGFGSPGAGEPVAAGSWPPGTYVLRVQPGEWSSALWFAFDLAGPWSRPAATGGPADTSPPSPVPTP
jgi:hypothetical protein